MPRGLELLITRTILQGFDAWYGRFLEAISGAQWRFEQVDWYAVQQAVKDRIHLYDHRAGLIAKQLCCITNGQSADAVFLLCIKEHYMRLLPNYLRFEIAGSFFNSAYCRLFDYRSLIPEWLFIFSFQPECRFRTIPRPLVKGSYPDHSWESLLMRAIGDLPLCLRWQSKSRDTHHIIRHLTEALGIDSLTESHLQAVNELLYHNKAVWLVDKLIVPSGTLPPLLSIHQTDDGGLFTDARLATTAEASIVLDSARSYFMVYVSPPAALTEWLREILPGRTTAESYMAIGCQKYARTENHHECLVYLQSCNEQFIEAPGIRGMVTLVLTLLGSNRASKVIKDKFVPQKEASAAHVRVCCQPVKEHDRVGRMADTQELENFALEKWHISPVLMELLLQRAAGRITDPGEQIIIRHLCIE